MATYFERMGEPDKARRHLEACLEIQPDHFAIEMALARVLMKSGGFEEADALLEKVLAKIEGESFPEAIRGRQDAYGRLATSLAWQGRAEDAARVVERARQDRAAVADSSSNVRTNFTCTHLALGELFRSQGKDEEAARALVQAAEFGPDNPQAQYLAARQLYYNGHYQQAAIYIERALELYDAEIHRGLAARIKRQIDHPSPLSDLPAEGLRDAAMRSFDRGECALAHEQVDAAQALEPHAEGRVLRAYLLLMERRVDDAEEALDRCLEERPGDAGAQVGQAHLALARQDNVTALRLVEPLLEGLRAPLVVVEVEPDGYDWMVFKMAHLAVAWSHSNLGAHELALAHFEAVLAYQSKDVLALLGRSNSRNFLGRFDEAERDLEHVLALSPGNPWAKAELGLIRLNQGDDQGAAANFEAALEAEPDGYTCPHEGMGLVYLRQGRIEEASRSLTQAIEINPSIQFHKYNQLARIRIDQGDYAEARDLLQQSIRNYPQDPEAARMLEEIDGL